MRVPERARRAGDLVIALALAVLVCENVLTDPRLTPKPALVVFGLALTLPLAWRRRHPATVAIVATIAYALLNGFSRGPYPPDIAVIPAIVAVFSGAAYTRGRVALVVGVATFVAVEVAWVVTPDGTFGQFVPWLLWGGPFGVGRLTRRRDTTVSELTMRTQLLEERRATAERDAARSERDRIARELHDVIAHAVSVMVVQAGAERLALSAAGADSARTTEALGRIERAGREALAELRAMLGVLRNAHDEPYLPAGPQPRLDAVHELVDRLVAEGVDVRLDVLGEPMPGHDAVGLSAYRIVQEGLTNAVKHGAGEEIHVRIRYDVDALDVEVTNPCRSTPATAARGYGLIGARERAASLGGEFHSGRRGNQWVLTARLPCAPTAVAASP